MCQARYGDDKYEKCFNWLETVFELIDFQIVNNLVEIKYPRKMFKCYCKDSYIC